MERTLIAVDIESDGPAPGLYSMVSFGAVIIEPSLSKTFYAETAPISENWLPVNLSKSGKTREEHLMFPAPAIAMKNFETWLKNNSKEKPIFISDNNGYDWSFINHYFIAFLGYNPFGWSSRRAGDLAAGFFKNMHVNGKNFRKTKHTHHPVDDAKGTAEIILELERLGLKI